MSQHVVELVLSTPAYRQGVLKRCEQLKRPMSPQALYAWRKLKRGVPPDRVAIVSEVTGIPAHEIRPDVFPAPEEQAPEESSAPYTPKTCEPSSTAY